MSFGDLRPPSTSSQGLYLSCCFLQELDEFHLNQVPMVNPACLILIHGLAPVPPSLPAN